MVAINMLIRSEGVIADAITSIIKKACFLDVLKNVGGIIP